MVKRNVKTILALFMVFILAAAMVGCAGSNSGTEGNSDTQLSEQTEENSEDEKDTSLPKKFKAKRELMFLK